MKAIKIIFFAALTTTQLINQTAIGQTAYFVANGASVKIVANGTVNLVLKDVNYKNNASTTHFSGSNSTVRIIGAAAGALSVSSSSAFASTFGNVVMNRPNGLTLLAPVTSTGTLTMSAGNISTTASNLLTVGASSASPGSVSWTSGTVLGPMKRFYNSAAGAGQATGIFPVGNSSYNRYAQINFTSANAVGSITAEYIAGLCPILNSGLPATVNGQLIQNYEEEGYWSITPTSVDNTAIYSIVLRGNTLTTPTALTPLRIIKSRTHTTWDNTGIGVHSSASGPNNDFLITNTGMTGFSWFNIGSSNAMPLPVTLLDFSASCENKEVKLHWSTASEQNAQTFRVERSRNLDQWVLIEEIQASGNSSNTINYSAIDSDPMGGDSYYRLVQVDNDGLESVYDPISTSCQYGENNMIVFPNPSAGNFTVEIISNDPVLNAEIELLDISGKLIDSRNADLKGGKNHFFYDNMDLQMGTYIVRIKSKEKIFTPVRFVINK